MRLATTTYDFTNHGGQHYSTEEAMKYIKQCGFKYLDYGFSYSNPGEVFTDNWKNYIMNIKNLADELNLEFVQAHAPMARSASTPIDEDNDDFVNDNIRCIKCCADLGINNIVVHSGYTTEISKEENFERNRKFYNRLLGAAEEHGVNILTENFTQMHHESGVYWTDSAEDLLELINFVDHPFFHACWDFGHANTLKTPPDESLRILGDHVMAVHVQDNMGIEHPKYGYTDPHMAPFFGSINWDCVMNGLLEIGYKGAFTLETSIIFAFHRYKNQYEKDTRLAKPLPLDIQLNAESLVYKMSKYILESYNCFEG